MENIKDKIKEKSKKHDPCLWCAISGAEILFFLPTRELDKGGGGWDDTVRVLWEVKAIFCSLSCANQTPKWIVNCYTSSSPNCSLLKDTGKSKVVASGVAVLQGIWLLGIFPPIRLATSQQRWGWKSRVGRVAIKGETQTKPICSIRILSLRHKIHANVFPSWQTAQCSLWLLYWIEGFWPAIVNTQSVCVCTCKAKNPRLDRCNALPAPFPPPWHVTPRKLNCHFLCSGLRIPDLVHEQRNLSRRGSERNWGVPGVLLLLW